MLLKTVEDVRRFVQDNEVKMIDFRMIDINGRWHHLTIPVERFSEDTMTAGIGFDGSNYGFARWSDTKKLHKYIRKYAATKY